MAAEVQQRPKGAGTLGRSELGERTFFPATEGSQYLESSVSSPGKAAATEGSQY
jgi:hypothetical protein